MIEAFIGLPGMGKTLGATERVCRALKRGVDVYSNVPITDYLYGSERSTKIFRGLKTFLTVKNALIFMDEANILLDSRQFGRTPPEVLHKLAQSRKYGLDLIYTTQGFKHSEARLRQLTNYVWDARRINVLGAPIFRYDLYDPEDFEMKTPKFYRERLSVYWLFPWFFVRGFSTRFKYKYLKKLYSCYDTFDIIDVIDLQTNDRHHKVQNTDKRKFSI